ncbi:acyl-CoA dehydrogenase family protein [Paraburkholderia sp. D15]|uniref:acyl-CoA dehydrogenase family protein n=1 Tax=Paraburkholderia sp. D15 TaxID=2880218 RepID=UPI002479997F|nr:acyl-CoA dehydrogenase family protein [Paraburkholderia sp. D15]
MVLDQDHVMVRDALRTFVREAVTPHAAAWDRVRIRSAALQIHDGYGYPRAGLSVR